jgi:SAM-dependent methyltransferase
LEVFFQAGWDCYGVDVSPKAIEAAGRFGQAFLRRGEDEPLYWFEDDFFDVSLAIAVFHHISAVEFSLSEVVRCLKPGGILLFYEIVEDSPCIRMLRNIRPEFRDLPVLSRMYARDWLDLLPQHGLEMLASFEASFFRMMWEVYMPPTPNRLLRRVPVPRFHRFVQVAPSGHAAGIGRVLYVLKKARLRSNLKPTGEDMER